MKQYEMEKIDAVITADFDTLCEIVGEYGDEAWSDEDIEMLMEKHGMTGAEAVAILKELSAALYSINTIAVKAADKAAVETLSHFDLDEREMGAMHTDVWHSASEGVREQLLKDLRQAPATFMASIRPMR